MIIIECQDCGVTTAEIRNGTFEVFTARLPCKDGCPRDQGETMNVAGGRADREALAHLASIRSEGRPER